MKTKRMKSLTKNIMLGIFATVIVLTFDSCTKKIDFLPSTIVPAARGYVQVKKDKNKNYVIKINLSELAEVERLQTSKQSYVVWTVSDQGETKNLGRINSSSNTLSKKLKATFKSVSTFKPTKIFITAENMANASYPGEQVILTTDNF